MDADESIAAARPRRSVRIRLASAATQEGTLTTAAGLRRGVPISRYVVDDTVLPIFEGVKPILELKVIARQLLAG